MLFAAFGPPCPLAEQGFRIVRAVIETAVGPVDNLTANTTENLRDELKLRQQAHSLYLSNAPEPGILDLFCRSFAPAVVFTEEPERLIQRARIECQLSAVDAIRSIVKWFAIFYHLIARRETLLITSLDKSSLPALIEEIAAFYQLNWNSRLTETSLLILPTDLVPDEGIPAASRTEQGAVVRHGTGSESHAADDAALIAAFLPPLESLTRRQQSLGTVVWPHRVYCTHDEKSFSPSSGEMSVVGPSRVLAYGPYMYLPKGMWTASYFLRFEENLSRNDYTFDIFSGGVTMLAEALIAVNQNGRFRFDLNFEVENPSLALEARILLKTGAIEGLLTFERVELNLRNE